MVNINSKYFDNQDLFLKYAINTNSSYLIFTTPSTPINLEDFNKNNIHKKWNVFLYN